MRYGFQGNTRRALLMTLQRAAVLHAVHNPGFGGVQGKPVFHVVLQRDEELLAKFLALSDERPLFD